MALTQRIRNHAKYDELPVVLVTSLAQRRRPQARPRCRRQRLYYQKRFRPESFARNVKAADLSDVFHA